jgi:hypothetical protein
MLLNPPVEIVNHRPFGTISETSLNEAFQISVCAAYQIDHVLALSSFLLFRFVSKNMAFLRGKCSNRAEMFLLPLKSSLII